MHLIFGGAYQGKLDYAKERYQLKDQDIFFCSAGEGEGPSEPQIDFTGKAVDRLEDFVLCCVRSGMEAKDYLEANRAKWKDTVFICTDISSGVVPYEKELRAWREMVGRTLMYLGKEAGEVTRIFCGLPQNIK
jgi:adenosyl cobinamide kinase/adenosyl cobinamide phosphate guanylyltransferase